jgi:hypothetical protein
MVLMLSNDVVTVASPTHAMQPSLPGCPLTCHCTGHCMTVAAILVTILAMRQEPGVQM